MVSVEAEKLSWFGFTKGLIEGGIQRLKQGQLGVEGQEDNLRWTKYGSPVVPLPNKCIYQDRGVSGFSLARIGRCGGVEITPLSKEIKSFTDAAEIARCIRVEEGEWP